MCATARRRTRRARRGDRAGRRTTGGRCRRRAALSSSLTRCAPMPLATTPRSTSFVPPRSVNNGECSRAVASSPRSRSACGDRASTPSIRSAATSTDSCSKRVPRSLTSAARLAASSPVGQARGRPTSTAGAATIMRAIRSPTSAAVRSSTSCSPSARTAAKTSVAVDRIRSGPTAFEAQLGGDLVPAVADLAEHVGVGDERRRRRCTSLKWCSPFISWIGLIVIPGGVGRHDELAEAGVAVLRIERAGAGQHDDLVRDVRAAGPHLGAVEQPAAVGRDSRAAGPRRGPSPRRARSCRSPSTTCLRRCGAAAAGAAPRCRRREGRAPPGGRRSSARRRARPRRAAPRSPHSDAGSPSPWPPYSVGDGQADEPGVGEPDGELGIPLREPGVHRGFPAVSGAISGQEIPDRRTQLGQFAVVGAQGVEFAH